MNATLLANAPAMTAVVMLLVSLLSPFVEAVPLFADTPANKTLHDAALRLLNVALNVAVVFLFAAATGGVTLADVLPFLVQALTQAAGAHFAYQVVTSSGGASSASAATPAVASEPPDFPPGAPNVQALGLPVAESEPLAPAA